MSATVRLTSKLNSIAAGMEARAQAQKVAAAGRIADDMRANVAVLSGATRESIESGPDGPDAVVTADLPWRQLEYGTVHMAAKPFVTPAVEAERGRFLSLLARAILG